MIWSIQPRTCRSGRAPVNSLTICPWKTALTAGIPWTAAAWAMRWLASTSILARIQEPLPSAASFSRIGESCLHGPHQSAQKSMTTGTSRLFSRTSDWKVASVTSMTVAGPPGPPAPPPGAPALDAAFAAWLRAARAPRSTAPGRLMAVGSLRRTPPSNRVLGPSLPGAQRSRRFVDFASNWRRGLKDVGYVRIAHLPRREDPSHGHRRDRLHRHRVRPGQHPVPRAQGRPRLRAVRPRRRERRPGRGGVVLQAGPAGGPGARAALLRAAEAALRGGPRRPGRRFLTS